MRSGVACLALGLLVSASGCGQPINVDKEIQLNAYAHYPAILVEAPKYDQNITVEFTSSDAPVDVHVILGKDENAITEEFGRAKTTHKKVASKLQSKADTLSCTIPAGEDYGVYLTGAKKNTTVKLKLKGK